MTDRVVVQSEVSGECPRCHYSYVPGSIIALDGTRWVHARCPTPVDTTRNALHAGRYERA